jgi:hypothetical protein
MSRHIQFAACDMVGIERLQLLHEIERGAVLL